MPRADVDLDAAVATGASTDRPVGFVRPDSSDGASGKFEAACHDVLAHLHERLGFGLWMITRAVGDDWIVLSSLDTKYGVASGDLFRWSDSFCSRMVSGLGPRVAPRASSIPAFAEAPIGHQLTIGSYIGIPITNPDGELFGTMCAIDPDEHEDAIIGEQPLLELLARLLTSILQADLQTIEKERLLTRALQEANVDPLTGLLNRRAWDEAVEREEARCRRYGMPATILAMDVDGLKILNDGQGHQAGDELLQRIGDVLRTTSRTSDTIARLGGDEFAVLAPECGFDQGEALYRRYRQAFGAAGIAMSIGVAQRRPGNRGDLTQALAEADAAMYAEKHSAI